MKDSLNYTEDIEDIGFDVVEIEDILTEEIDFDEISKNNRVVSIRFAEFDVLNQSKNRGSSLKNDSLTIESKQTNQKEVVEKSDNLFDADFDLGIDLFNSPIENLFEFSSNDDFSSDDIDLDFSFDLFDSSNEKNSSIDKSLSFNDFIDKSNDLTSTNQDTFDKSKVSGVFPTVEVTDNINEDNLKEEFKGEKVTLEQSPQLNGDTQELLANTDNQDEQKKLSWLQRRKAKKQERIAKELELDAKVIEYGEQIEDIKDQLRVLKGKKPHGKVFKFFFGSIRRVAAVLAVCTVIGSSSYISYYFYQDSQHMVKGFENEGVIYWINNFVAKDYIACDSMIHNESDKILTFDRLEYFQDDDYYTMLIDSLGSSITGVDILNYYTEESRTEYTIKVSYNRFKDITKLQASDSVKAEFKSIKNDYKNGKIQLDEAQKRYESLHKQIFKECCLKTTSEPSFVELTLTEYHSKDGTVYVEGTDKLLNDLIVDSHAKHNIGVFQQKIEKFTEEMIKL